MPGVIASLFSLPKMHDYHYRILLDRDARTASRCSSAEGEVLWLQLEDRRWWSRGVQGGRALDRTLEAG